MLRKLSIHPDVKLPENRLALAQAEDDVENGLAKLEILKPRINKRWERYEQLMKERDARKATESPKKSKPPSEIETIKDERRHKYMPSDPTVAGSTEPLAADDNHELAVRLAHKEIKRRANARKATRRAGISEEVEHERRTAGLWGDWEEALAHDVHDIDRDVDIISRRMQKFRFQAEPNGTANSHNGKSRPAHMSSKSSYIYPTVPEKRTLKLQGAESSAVSNLPQKPPKEDLLASPPPKPPPKDHIVSQYRSPPPKPARPDMPTPGIISPVEIASPVQTELQPSGYTFKPSAYLENGSPLRTIFLPPNLRHSFLSLAQANTRANLETCGILCGTLISNALFISKLVIPDQESTSDTCETVNESDLFDYVDGEDLMVLGWIHTHPTQTCFMSSRDLHTHCGYQMMMPESIAIVCAPSKGE